ncbi:MAG: LLM class flavin-dependent oxidoreductase [Acidimicrobiales bacterium]
MCPEPGDAARLARAAEAAGIESLLTVEHIVWPTEYDSVYPYSPTGRLPGGPDTALPDPLIWMAHVAAHTTTLRLLTGVLVLPQRNPLLVAKQVATLDALSGGRIELGIGVGWLREEFEALGVPFEGRGGTTAGGSMLDLYDDRFVLLLGSALDAPQRHRGRRRRRCCGWNRWRRWRRTGWRSSSGPMASPATGAVRWSGPDGHVAWRSASEVDPVAVGVSWTGCSGLTLAIIGFACRHPWRHRSPAAPPPTWWSMPPAGSSDLSARSASPIRTGRSRWPPVGPAP